MSDDYTQYHQLNKLSAAYNALTEEIKAKQKDLEVIRQDIVDTMIKLDMSSYANGHYSMKITEKLELDKPLTPNDKKMIRENFSHLLNEPSINSARVCEAIANGELTLEGNDVSTGVDIKLSYSKTEQSPTYTFNN